jgi:hypothetical protein
MAGGDQRLQLVGPDVVPGDRGAQDRARLVDLRPVPPRPILFLEGDHIAGGVGSRGTARVLEEHQREQAGGLGLARHQAVHQAREPDRLDAEVDPDQV